MIKKIFYIILIAIITTILASLYGALHNQITHAISLEYFTKLKFDQFRLWENAFNGNVTLQVAYVGILSTYWFGFIWGLVISILLTFHQSALKISLLLRAIIIQIATMIIFGIIGYIIGLLFINDLGMDLEFISSLNNSKAFAVAGSIHNFSYLGGIIGLGISSFYVVKSVRINYRK